MSMHALFGGPTPEVVKAKLFSLMTEHGATRLQAEYSGGNDEGGIQDTIKLFKGDEEIAAPEMWNTTRGSATEASSTDSGFDGMR